MADTRKRILIVESNPHDAQKLAGILADCDYQVTLADNRNLALKTAGEGSVDMVIADHDRHINGIDLTREIKRTNADVKVVMMSDTLDLDTYLKVMNHGCDDCLEKSCKKEELLRVVGCVMKHRVEAHSGMN